MTNQIIIIALVISLIYLYYQNKKLQPLPHSTSPDNSTRTIFELDEDKEDLIADKDLALRQKNEAEQEVSSLTNQLRNKQTEVGRKETEIERLKKEFEEKDKSLNQKITEKNGPITTQQKELNQFKDKYSKQGKQLDEEQLENSKLTQEIEKLQEQITELNRSKSPIPGKFPEEDKTKLEQDFQEKLRKINLLFDPQAKDYETIDFNGLYSLLQKVARTNLQPTEETKTYDIDKYEIWLRKKLNTDNFTLNSFKEFGNDWIDYYRKYYAILKNKDLPQNLQEWMKEVDQSRNND